MIANHLFGFCTQCIHSWFLIIIWQKPVIRQHRKQKKNYYCVLTFLCNSLMGAKWVLCHVSKCAIVSTQLQSDKVALESPLKKYSKVLSGHQITPACLNGLVRGKKQCLHLLLLLLEEWCQDCHLLSDKNICVDWGRVEADISFVWPTELCHQTQSVSH